MHHALTIATLLLSPSALALATTGATSGRRWDVVLRRGSERHVVTVDENTPVLAAVEEAGLLPQSNCRRGNCLSCAAQVVAGSPYTLQVGDMTSLCSQAHAQGIVLLCSAFATGPGLELELDQEWRALDIQFSGRFAPRNRGVPFPTRSSRRCRVAVRPRGVDVRARPLHLTAELPLLTVQPPPAVRVRPTAPARLGQPHFQMPELKEHLEEQLLAKRLDSLIGEDAQR